MSGGWTASGSTRPSRVARWHEVQPRLATRATDGIGARPFQLRTFLDPGVNPLTGGCKTGSTEVLPIRLRPLGARPPGPGVPRTAVQVASKFGTTLGIDVQERDRPSARRRGRSRSRGEALAAFGLLRRRNGNPSCNGICIDRAGGAQYFRTKEPSLVGPVEDAGLTGVMGTVSGQVF